MIKVILSPHDQSYDSRDRRHTYQDPAGHVETDNYDGMSNLTSVVDRKGQTTYIAYDGIDRPTLITFQDNSTIAITWDGGNRPTTFVDSLNGTISRTYDLLDRLTQETSPQGQINYTYDTASRRQTMTVAGQAAINYTFDADNRLTQIAQGTTVVGIGYDAASRRTTVTLPNTIMGTYSFDNASQLTGISYAKGSTTVGTLGYSYDGDGRRISVSGTLAGFVAPTSVPNVTYDGTNRLTSWNGSTLSYDADGTLASFGSTTYTWNARNQMTATNAVSASFVYDALGRRVSATVSGTTTPYLYDGLNAAMVSTSQIIAGSGLDEIYSQISTSGTTSFLPDGVNSTAALTNSSAAITKSYLYSPYGDSAGSGTASTAYQYSGRENDGTTGRYYYRARYYAPQLGRFISEDPLGIGGGTNVYAYAGGNPLQFNDPRGHELALAFAGAVVGGAWGGINGFLAGDRGAALYTDIGSGVVVGGLAGLTNGASLIEGVLVRATIGAVAEADRQAVNGLIAGCTAINWADIVLAGGGSVLGDAAGFVGSTSGANSVADLLHYMPSPSELTATVIGGYFGGIVQTPVSAIEGWTRH